jgi:hypothetical protein
MPKTDDLQRLFSEPLSHIIRAPILFLFIRVAASNKLEFAGIVKMSQYFCSFK